MNPEHEEIFRNVGNQIATVRRLNGIKQNELAEAVGLEVTTISKMENAKVGISIPTLLKIAEALDVHPGVLLDFNSLDKLKSWSPQSK